MRQGFRHTAQLQGQQKSIVAIGSFARDAMNLDGDRSKLACSLAGEVVQAFGEVCLRVFGTSMVPSILPGDLIFVERVGLSEISPGEVVLFTHKGGLAVHRVV